MSEKKFQRQVPSLADRVAGTFEFRKEKAERGNHLLKFNGYVPEADFRETIDLASFFKDPALALHMDPDYLKSFITPTSVPQKRLTLAKFDLLEDSFEHEAFWLVGDEGIPEVSEIASLLRPQLHGAAGHLLIDGAPNLFFLNLFATRVIRSKEKWLIASSYPSDSNPLPKGSRIFASVALPSSSAVKH